MALKEVVVHYRIGSKVDEWMIEINPLTPIVDLLPGLIEVMGLAGDASQYTIAWEGSIQDPIIVITPAGARNVWLSLHEAHAPPGTQPMRFPTCE